MPEASSNPSRPAHTVKDCPYCGGWGTVRSGLSPLERRCPDCDGAKKVCILCIKPVSQCECTAAQLDGSEPTKRVRPGGSLPSQ